MSCEVSMDGTVSAATDNPSSTRDGALVDLRGMGFEFDAATRLAETDTSGVFTGAFSQDWAIGPAVNGGVVMALAAAAVTRVLGQGETPHADPLAFSAHFLSASAEGGAQVATEILPPERLPERSTYVFCANLSVSAPIFQPGLSAWVMLTDEAARRLAAAHLEGVAFRDVTRYRPDGQFVRLDD